MNITTYYQSKNFDLKVTKHQSQTNPSFGINKHLVEQGAKAIKPLVIGAAVTAGTVIAMQNGSNPPKVNKNNIIPTKEEFKAIMEKDGIDEYEQNSWLNAYNNNAEKTIAFYILEDSDGNKFIDNEELIYYNIRDEKFFSHPELVQQVVNTEDENGLHPFSFTNACEIVNIAADNSNGLTKMLSLKDGFGRLRFSNIRDYIAAEVFEKYPEEAEKYANSQDEIGNYRFNGESIAEIVKAKKEGIIKPEDIENVLNLRRNDGSYVYPHYLPDNNIIELYADNKKIFTEICSIKTADGNYVEPNTSLVRDYEDFPNETKHLLQLADDFGRARFSQIDIGHCRLSAPKFYKKAPKTFMALALLKDSRDNNEYRFCIDDICTIITDRDYSNRISEFNKEDFKTIFDLSRVTTLQIEDNRVRPYRILDKNEIIYLFNTYKKYPIETKEIMKNYYIEDKWGNTVSLIPSEKDVELYINNRAEFDKKYPQEEYHKQTV